MSGMTGLDLPGVTVPAAPTGDATEAVADQTDKQIDGEDAAGDAVEDTSLIARLPFEILASILAQIAIDSPKAFVRTQMIGRSFWIPYDSALLWEPICRQVYPDLGTPALDVDDYGGYYNLFRECPAIRHDGVYVCTSRYFRDGEPEGISWTKPRHEVRYYRYLWLEPDGTCRSLLANHSPKHMLGLGTPHAPVASKAYRQDMMVGQWHLDRKSKELSISVDGGRRRSQFFFALRVASSGGKVHNKLKWQKYWCAEHRSGSVAEFNTENEGSYYFLKYARHDADQAA